jgi:hypothetical protein
MSCEDGMAYSVLTERELLKLAEDSAADRREQVEQAVNVAESRGWIFVGVDRAGKPDASYIFRSEEGRLRLGNIR